jgi:hypothetical protein
MQSAGGLAAAIFDQLFRQDSSGIDKPAKPYLHAIQRLAAGSVQATSVLIDPHSDGRTLPQSELFSNRGRNHDSARFVYLCRKCTHMTIMPWLPCMASTAESEGRATSMWRHRIETEGYRWNPSVALLRPSLASGRTWRAGFNRGAPACGSGFSHAASGETANLATKHSKIVL